MVAPALKKLLGKFRSKSFRGLSAGQRAEKASAPCASSRDCDSDAGGGCDLRQPTVPARHDELYDRGQLPRVHEPASGTTRRDSASGPTACPGRRAGPRRSFSEGGPSALLHVDAPPNSLHVFLREYQRGPVVGRGLSGPVFIVKAKRTGEKFACKMLRMDHVAPSPRGEPGCHSQDPMKDVKHELDMLKTLNHPSFVHLHDYFLDGKRCMLVMELLYGGNLGAYLHERGGRLSEAEAKAVMRSIMQGLEFIHSRGIAHRDMKLENVMLMHKDDLSSARIVNLDMAKALHSSSVNLVCGSPMYVAPEVLVDTINTEGVLKSEYDVSVDMWSCGIMLYIMLLGQAPYQPESDSMGAMFKEVARCAIGFDGTVGEYLSLDGLDFLKRLLAVNPRRRISAARALSHPWFCVVRSKQQHH